MILLEFRRVLMFFSWNAYAARDSDDDDDTDNDIDDEIDEKKRRQWQ